MEKTNIRYVVPEDLGEPADFSSIDVSFISLTKVLLPVRNLLTDEGEIVCLIKPQFEAGKEKVGKKGVVRDPAVHQEVIEKVRDYAMSIFMEPCHLSFSPIKGPEGNIEYLLHLKKHPEGNMRVPFIIQILIRFRTIHSVLLFWEEMAHFFRQQGMWCIRKFLFLESIWEIWVFLQK